MTTSRKIITISILAVLLFAVVLPLSAVFADEVMSAEQFDKQHVLDDLKDAQIFDKTFDIADYPLNANGTPQLLSFVEFGFSKMTEYQLCYGLYLYVYYPQGGLVDDVKNTVSIATSYNSVGEPSDYTKLPIKLLSSDGSGVIYKFKVINSDTVTIGNIYNRVFDSSDARRYDVTSIELMSSTDATNAIDYDIGGTWTISGYGKGLHESSLEQSTLQSVAKVMNTLKLDVHQTYYRAWRNADDTWADQLSSVYFSVDNKVDGEYDQLYAIDFEAYKYLSSPIFCIYDKPIAGYLTVNVEQIYKNLLNQRGLTSSEVMKLSQYTALTWDRQYTGDIFMNFGGYARTSNGDSQTNLDCLAWVLPISANLDYKVNSETLLKYMSDFSVSFGCDVKGKYSSLLFADHYYFRELDYRSIKNGVNIGREIKATETGTLIGSSSKHNIWEYLSLLFKTYDDTEIDFSPIQKVYYTEIAMLSDAEISAKYFVDEAEVLDFKSYVKQQNDLNKSVYLFRFDVDTYYATELWQDALIDGKCGYVAQEPIYLDFDIISLTYEKDNVLTVIPVVSNPIDIIASVEAPGNSLDLNLNNFMVDVYTAMILLVIIVAVLVLAPPILKWIFRL